jgi:hypothetical protein
MIGMVAVSLAGWIWRRNMNRTEDEAKAGGMSPERASGDPMSLDSRK